MSGYLIGIMQGRLSPPIGDRIQGFPSGSWKEEFSVAKNVGLDGIEWVYEYDETNDDPLRSETGIEEVRAVVNETGLPVTSVCADYFMVKRFVSPSGNVESQPVEHLRKLLHRAGRIGARHIVLPFVDSSSLRTKAQREALDRVLESVLPDAEHSGVEIHLETDFSPDVLYETLRSSHHPLVRANYDIGNSASLGYDPREEFEAIGDRLGSVHVKDRVKRGGTVPLGTGDADFETCFSLIVQAGFLGPFILQTARSESGAEADLARNNISFVLDRLAGIDFVKSGGIHP